MFKKTAYWVLFATILFLTGCGDGGGSGASLVSITVTPANSSIAAGTSLQYLATGTYSDNSTRDLSSVVTWSSSSTSTATIDTTGKVTALVSGSTTISAALSGKTGSTDLTVTNATLQSIAVTPSNPSIGLGTSQQFVATGTFSDSSTQDITVQVTWSSSDLAKATISSGGLATSVAAGTTTISASLSGQTGTTALTVTAATLSSIAVTPANSNVDVATTRQFTAIGTYSDSSTQDLTTQVTWSSSATGVAVVSNAVGTKGLAAGVSSGTSTIVATLGAVSGSTGLTVTTPTLVSIAVTPSSQSISVNPAGTSQQYAAIGTYTSGPAQDLTSQVIWSSDNASVATISNTAGSKGKATTVTAGTAHITASLGAVISNQATLTVTSATLVSIAVTPTNQNLPRGQILQLTAIGSYSNTTTQNLTDLVSWSSSDSSVATVGNSIGSKGLVRALSLIGSSTITATSGLISGNTDVEVE